MARPDSASRLPASTIRHPGDELVAAGMIVERLSVAEKARLCQGATFWRTHGLEAHGVASVMVADGPHGMRVAAGDDHVGLAESRPATCFPTASALAATWDTDLVEEVGAAIGREARAQGVDVVLGPGANIKRSPLCGRNFEYFSEDPFLTGAMATAHVAGVQATGAGTSLKHFAANNQEYRRLTIDAVIDERTLREIYLPGFEAAVRAARPWTLMCAYNRINGVYASDNQWLLDEVLRGEWGHEGIVITDWGAMNDRVAAIGAGCELEMPGPVAGAADRLEQAVVDGDLDETLLDRAATRLVAVALAAAANRDREVDFDVDDHHALARRVAADAVVLLRNVDDALPIGDGDTVAVIGRMAVEPRYQGTGSSRINPTRLDNLSDELVRALGADRVTWVAGHHGDDVDDDLLDEAVVVARQADVAIVHVGLPDLHENEGDDRADLDLPPAHDALVAALAAVHDRVIVVLSNGSPVAMPWVDQVDAVVEGHLGGQAGAGGLADVLTGEVAPSGRLAETFPSRLSDVSSTAMFPGGPSTVEYREGIWVGYRHTESAAADVDVLFPFGHGVTYGTVETGQPRLDVERISTRDLDDGATVTVSVPVTNISDRDLRHVVQVYVHDVEAAVPRPRRELKGFTKVAVAPGETVTATVELDRRALAWWDVETPGWVVEGGRFTIEVGNSARDIVATVLLQVDGERMSPRPGPRGYARPARTFHLARETFAEVLGHAPPANPPFQPPWDHNTPLGAVDDTIAGRVLQRAIRVGVERMMGDDPAARPLVEAMVSEAPLRSLLMQGVSLDQLDALVAVLNRDWSTGGRTLFAEVRGLLDRGWNQASARGLHAGRGPGDAQSPKSSKAASNSSLE